MFVTDMFGTNYVRAFHRVRGVQNLFFPWFAQYEHTQVRAIQKIRFFFDEFAH